MDQYYSADITWCNCGCKNTKCEYHIKNLDPMRGSGMYSMADRSKCCPNYSKDRKENSHDPVQHD